MRFVWKGSRKQVILMAAMLVGIAAFLSSCLKESTIQSGESKMVFAFSPQSVPF
jgi:hypothetical protein